MYLKDHVPYLDSSLFIVILRIQLELIYWATTPLVVLLYDVVNCLIYTYIPSLLTEPTVVLPIRFRYIITTIVTVKENKLI